MKQKREIINPGTPKKSAECQRGYGHPQKRWTERCSTCEGTGRIISLRNGEVPCPRCRDEFDGR